MTPQNETDSSNPKSNGEETKPERELDKKLEHIKKILEISRRDPLSYILVLLLAILLILDQDVIQRGFVANDDTPQKLLLQEIAKQHADLKSAVRAQIDGMAPDGRAPSTIGGTPINTAVITLPFAGIPYCPIGGQTGCESTSAANLNPAPAKDQPKATEKHASTGNERPTAQQTAAAAKPPRVYAKWAQLIPPNRFCGSIDPEALAGEASRECEPKVLVRAIIEEGQDCKKVAVRLPSNRPLTMVIREKPQQAFEEVRVCEAKLELDGPEVAFADGGRLSWAGLRAMGSVVVIGDTGCDTTVSQRCESITSWPFPKIAADAAFAGTRSHGTAGPDLVIHVGDYRYREGSKGDNWKNWYEDFFSPAARLLEAAPWVMVRGNHESCYDKQGPGWFYFLQPEYQVVSQCPPEIRRHHTDNLPPYALDLQVAGQQKKLRFIILDSTDSKYRCKQWADDFERLYSQALNDLLASSDEAWLVTHYPIWDISAPLLKDKTDKNAGLNSFLECESKYYNEKSVHLYRKLVTSAIDFKFKVKAVLSGDTHHFQVLRAHSQQDGIPSPKSEMPLQFVAGNGGTLLGPVLGLTNENTCEHRPTYFQRELSGSDENGSYTVLGKAVCEYGFLEAAYTEDEQRGAWSFDLVGTREVTAPARTTCQLGSASRDCYHNDGKEDCISLGGQADCHAFSGNASSLPPVESGEMRESGSSP